MMTSLVSNNRTLLLLAFVLHVGLLHVNLIYKYYWSAESDPSIPIGQDESMFNIEELILSEEQVAALRSEVLREIESELSAKYNQEDTKDDGVEDETFIENKQEVNRLLEELKSVTDVYEKQLKVTREAYKDLVNSTDIRRLDDLRKFATIGHDNEEVNPVNPVVEAIIKVQSINSLNSASEILSRAISDLKVFRESCEQDTKMCDVFRFSTALPTNEGFIQPLHGHHICNEIKKSKAELSKLPKESDLGLYVEPIMDVISAREEFLTNESSSSLPLHPSCIARLSNELQEAVNDASKIFEENKQAYRYNIESLESPVDAVSDDCLQPSEIKAIVKEQLALEFERSHKNIISPYLGTTISIGLSSLAENIRTESVRKFLNSEFLDKSGMFLDQIVDKVGGHSSMVDRFIDLLAGDYGDGSGGGSLRSSFMLMLSRSDMNPMFVRIFRRISFLFALKSKPAPRSSQNFCLDRNDDGVGLLAFNFRQGYSARLMEVHFKLSDTSDKLAAPTLVKIFGVPNDSQSSENSISRIFLGQQSLDTEHSRYNLYLASGQRHDEDISEDEHSCKFDSRPTIQTLVFEFISSGHLKSSEPFCVNALEVIGDLTPNDQAPTCVG